MLVHLSCSLELVMISASAGVSTVGGIFGASCLSQRPEMAASGPHRSEDASGRHTTGAPRHMLLLGTYTPKGALLTCHDRRSIIAEQQSSHPTWALSRGVTAELHSVT
jgi:hypothetical protein